jgi:hypothetical protein
MGEMNGIFSMTIKIQVAETRQSTRAIFLGSIGQYLVLRDAKQSTVANERPRRKIAKILTRDRAPRRLLHRLRWKVKRNAVH